MIDCVYTSPILTNARHIINLLFVSFLQYSDFMNKIIDNPEEAFQNFDLTLNGDFSFPRSEITLFSFRKNFLVGGLIPMQFGNALNTF